MDFIDSLGDVTMQISQQQIQICTAALVTDATDGAKLGTVTVLETITGSVQPYRKPPSAAADIAGVALEPPTHRAFMLFSSNLNTLGAFLRVGAVYYYPTKPAMDVGGQGEYHELHLSTRRPA